MNKRGSLSFIIIVILVMLFLIITSLVLPKKSKITGLTTSGSPSPSATPSPTPSLTATTSSSPSPSPKPTTTPKILPSPTSSPSATPSPTPSPTAIPSKQLKKPGQQPKPGVDCTLTAAYFDITQAKDKQFVGLILKSENCIGKEAVFEIRETDGIFGSKKIQEITKTIESNITKIRWKTVWQDDNIFKFVKGDPEYIFKVSVNPEITSGNILRVSEEEISLVDKIIPKPKKVFTKEFSVNIGADWKIVVDKAEEKYLFSAKFLQEKLSDRLSLSILDVSEIPKDKYILIGNPKESTIVKEISDKKNLQQTPELGDEGYILNIDHDSIIIFSNAPNGDFYGVQTLVQLIEDDSVEAVNIIDYPDSKLRGWHFLVLNKRLNGISRSVIDLQSTLAGLDKLASLKINTAILLAPYYYPGALDYCGSYQTCEEVQKIYPDEKSNREKLQEIYKYARKLFIEPIPAATNFNDWSFYNNCKTCPEGFWSQNEKFKFDKNNVAIPVIPIEYMSENSWLLNPDFEINTNKGGIFNNWNVLDLTKPGTWEIDNTVSHSGSNSIRLTKKEPAGSSKVLSSQRYKVLPNTAYYITFWAKENKIDCDQKSLIRVWIGQRDSSGGVIEPGGWIPLAYRYDKIINSEWKKYYARLITRRQTKEIIIYSQIRGGCYGTIWLDDFNIKRMNACLYNVITKEDSAETDIKITNLDGTRTYRDGIDYKVTSIGEWKYYLPDQFGTRNTTIERIPTGNIKPDETVLISYDFIIPYGTEHPPTTIYYSFSEPKAYGVIFKGLGETIKTFNPKYIFIPHDEIRGFINRDSRSRKRGMTNAELLAEDINKIDDYIKSINPSIRLIMWDDMINPWDNGGDENYQVYWGGQPGKTSLALDDLPRDVIMDVWQYDAEDTKENKRANSPDYFEEKGFDYIVTPGTNEDNIKAWAQLIHDKNCLGIIRTDWSSEFQEVPLIADYSWQHDGVSEIFVSVCGNGEIDEGESCEPPGKKACDGDNLKQCNSDCQWHITDCNEQDKCDGQDFIDYTCSDNTKECKSTKKTCDEECGYHLTNKHCCPLGKEWLCNACHLPKCGGCSEGECSIDCLEEIGCFIDSDNDGISNAEDKCENTKQKDKINKVGCTLPIFNEFLGQDTTNFTDLDLNEVENLTLDSDKGKILFQEKTDVIGANLDEAIEISKDSIFVNSPMLTTLNVSAIITLYNINFVSPEILIDNEVCVDCEILSYEENILIFNVSHFTLYKIIEGPYCGNGICQPVESCSTCPADCGECPSPGPNPNPLPKTICTENWSCDWSDCKNNVQEYICTDLSSCNTTINRPPENGTTKSCSIKIDCIDNDGDGYGIGPDCLGKDLDDTNSSIKDKKIKEDKEKPKSNLLIYLIIILIILILIVLIIIILIIKREKRSGKNSKEQEREGAFEKAKLFIKNALKRGYTKEQIKAALLKRGWKESDVDKLLSNG